MAAAAAVATNVDDLVLLPDLSEDSILRCLKERHEVDNIYTGIGEVLVSVNPFHELKIFGTDSINRYRGRHLYELPPHIFGLAEETFHNLKTSHFNQSIIISGESGAGKTEAAKLVMKYIAAVCGSSKEIQRVKDQLLQSNPVLESFGNAQTLRNDNSSRFGKYLEMVFDFAGDPIGGTIRNFLLEKTRVVNPSEGERDFHIFYQIDAGLSAAEKDAIHWKGVEKFRYLRKSKQFRVKTIDDRRDYRDTMTGLKVCGIQPELIEQIKATLSAIMWLGEIEFKANSKHDHAEIIDEEPVKVVAELLKLSADKLSKALVSRGFVVQNVKTQTFLDVEQAQYTRDSLAKNIYGRLFDWLIERINMSIDPSLSPTYDPNYRMTIGVLDIYGFEIFDNNSFEQCMINYANEKLQQIFIERVLNSEQTEYADEGIEWVHIDYFNNKIVCDLIEAKPLGILSFLDEECTMPRGNDLNFLDKLQKNFSGHPQFKMPKMKFASDQKSFVIVHYAGDVTYNVTGFLDKNKDLVWTDLIRLGEESELKLFDEIYIQGEANHNDSKTKRAVTQGHQFKTQVHSLMDALLQCMPHYIRTIKPNDNKMAHQFDETRVRHQVKYLGLEENVRVRRAGYAARVPYDRFMKLYKMLSPRTWPRFAGTDREGTLELAKEFGWTQGEDFEMGKTKIFIQDGTSHIAIETKRSAAVEELVIKLQSFYRGYKARVSFKRTKSAIVFQKYTRGWSARQHTKRIRAANCIQRSFRRYAGAKEYVAVRKRIIAMLEDRKQRRRESLFRPFSGDYIKAKKNSNLIKALRPVHSTAQQAKQIVFADYASHLKVNSKAKAVDAERSILVITKHAIVLLKEGQVPPKNKPDFAQEGKYTVKRVIYIKHLEGLFLSTLADDTIIFRVTNDAMSKQQPPVEWDNSKPKHCYLCDTPFSLIGLKWRHHCRMCGCNCCASCSSRSQVLADYAFQKPQRVCDNCFGSSPSEFLCDYVVSTSKKTEIAALVTEEYKALCNDSLVVTFNDSFKFKNRDGFKSQSEIPMKFTEATANGLTRALSANGHSSNGHASNGHSAGLAQAASFSHLPSSDPVPVFASQSEIVLSTPSGLPPDYVKSQQEKAIERRMAADRRREQIQEAFKREAIEKKEERAQLKAELLDRAERKRETLRRAKEQSFREKESERQAQFETIRRKRMAKAASKKVAKCKVCGCNDFTAHELRTHKCSKCFHQH